jgi:peptidoglycan hydrolase CwlO-like protein
VLALQTLWRSVRSEKAAATSVASLQSPPLTEMAACEPSTPATTSSTQSTPASASSSTASLQSEMEQLRQQLASAQSERDSIRSERDRFKQQLESSDETIATVSFCTQFVVKMRLFIGYAKYAANMISYICLRLIAAD